MRRPDTLDRARKSVDSDKTTHYKPRDEEKSGKSARRVVYPAHIPKDIDKNHTHFVFVKSFACTVCGRPSEGGTGFCKDHDTEDGGMADEWNQRIWRDTMKVRDSLEDYLKGQRFIELLDTYNSGVKNREKWEEHGTSKTKKQKQTGAKQQDVDGSKPPPPGATILDRSSRREALAKLMDGYSAESIRDGLASEERPRCVSMKPCWGRRLMIVWSHAQWL